MGSKYIKISLIVVLLVCGCIACSRKKEISTNPINVKLVGYTFIVNGKKFIDLNNVDKTLKPFSYYSKETYWSRGGLVPFFPKREKTLAFTDYYLNDYPIAFTIYKINNKKSITFYFENPKSMMQLSDLYITFDTNAAEIEEYFKKNNIKHFKISDEDGKGIAAIDSSINKKTYFEFFAFHHGKLKQCTISVNRLKKYIKHKV